MHSIEDLLEYSSIQVCLIILLLESWKAYNDLFRVLLVGLLNLLLLLQKPEANQRGENLQLVWPKSYFCSSTKLKCSPSSTFTHLPVVMKISIHCFLLFRFRPLPIRETVIPFSSGATSSASGGAPSSPVLGFDDPSFLGRGHPF